MLADHFGSYWRGSSCLPMNAITGGLYLWSTIAVLMIFVNHDMVDLVAMALKNASSPKLAINHNKKWSIVNDEFSMKHEHVWSLSRLNQNQLSLIMDNDQFISLIVTKTQVHDDWLSL